MYSPIGITPDAIKMDETKKNFMKRKEELERKKAEGNITEEEKIELEKLESSLQSIENFEFLP